MGYGRLVSVLEAGDVLVEVGQAAGQRLGYVAQLVPRHHVGLQVVRQRALANTKTRLLIMSSNWPPDSPHGA